MGYEKEMGYEGERKPAGPPAGRTHVVEATDANGSVAGRDAFASEAEAEAHAAARRAEGYAVTVSSLEPTPKDRL